MEVATKLTANLFSPSTVKFADTNLMVIYAILTVVFTVSWKYELQLLKYLNSKVKTIFSITKFKTTGSRGNLFKTIKPIKRLSHMAKSFFTTHTIYTIRTMNETFMQQRYKKYLTLRTQFNSNLNKYSYDRLFNVAKYRHNKNIVRVDSLIDGDDSCYTTKCAAQPHTMPAKPSALAVASALSPEALKIYNPKIELYKKLPLRAISRLWGLINSIDLPVWARKPIYELYSWLFGCNLNEMAIEDLAHYKNLSEFFRRKLKPNAREICQTSSLVSPCDGRVLYCGVARDGRVEQVKGVTYSLKAFLGENTWSNNGQVQKSDDGEKYELALKKNPDNQLYHCIIYLAPGDYHRFHSPGDWSVAFRRHFPGELFSVNPAVARWLQGLFNLNERAVYYGDWQHGFFSMAAVGATNVGSIRVEFDPALETNRKNIEMDSSKLEKDFSMEKQGVQMQRGDDFGEFNLGSTIVLCFEAPRDFQFQVQPGQKVFLGQPLASQI